MPEHKRKPNCRKCGCHLDRVRRTLIERLFFVRVTYACAWCHRRRRIYFSKPSDSTVEYGGAILVDRQITIRKDDASTQSQPTQKTESTPKRKSVRS